MRNTIALAACALLAAACNTTRASYGSPDAATKHFDTLKTLAGRFESAPGTVDPKETVTYRVTAGGSVLMENLFPGTPHEMITMYHLDRGALMLTHYCAAGNQPSMRMSSAASDGTLTFECAGGTNLECDKDGHMHKAVIQVVDKDHLKSAWTFFKDGKPTETKGFDLVRAGT